MLENVSTVVVVRLEALLTPAHLEMAHANAKKTFVVENVAWSNVTKMGPYLVVWQENVNVSLVSVVPNAKNSPVLEKLHKAAFLKVSSISW